MKRAWWGMSVLLMLAVMAVPAAALDTVPSSTLPPKIAGPLMITGYSFSGHSLRYLQIHNPTSMVVDLHGWSVTVEMGTNRQVVGTLEGLIAPDRYVTVADTSVLADATLGFVNQDETIDPVLSSISLLSAPGLNYVNEVVTPVVTASTPRVDGSPPTFYFARNVSTSTGNYLSTYSAFIPGSDFAIISDPLYVAPVIPEISIVEVFADAALCSPFEVQAVCSDYVKVYNETTDVVDLSRYRIRSGAYGQAATSANTVSLQGVIGSGHYAAAAVSLSASGSWIWLEDRFGLRAYDQSLVAYPSNTGHDQQAWSYDDTTGGWRWTTHLTPSDAENEFDPIPKVNDCLGLMISEIAANVDDNDQFVEIANESGVSVDAAGCLIQTNRSQTRQYKLAGVLEPGERRVIYIKDTDLTLTKTTQGVVYLLSSDGLNEVDETSYDSLDDGTSWSLIDGSWRQTYTLTPDDGNYWTEYAPCAVGYERNVESGLCNKISAVRATLSDCGVGKYRNPDTNRCKALETAALSTCSEGQYRNPETNRCKSLAATTSLLTPCLPGQERNPETNRCRSVQPASGLKPCETNQERNPDTNRCRTKIESVAADFPVEVVGQSGQATLGW